MTLDEAIIHAEEVAEGYEEDISKWEYTLSEYRKRECVEQTTIPRCEKALNKCKQCASEHRQLAEWLKDYKRLKEQKPCEDCRNCKKWDNCECGRKGHINGTSIGYSIGECKDYEPCEDAISREEVLENAFKIYTHECGLLEVVGVATIKTLPSVKPQTGHWIIIDDCEKFIAKCSECGRIEDSRMISKYPYCHCGARMVEPQESEVKK